MANPPFGTSMKYKKWKKNGETFDGELETYEKKYPGNSVKFKDIYPIDTNNGACLFTQHFVYKIKENGLGIIILPDGELFDGKSKWSKTFREWLLTNVNLKMIIKMPQGTFEHAGVKTNVLVFIKNGKTKNIQYFDTTKKCNVVKELFTITEEDFKSTNYSLDMSDYLEEEETNFEVPMVKLSDICELKNGDQLDKKNIIPGEIPIYGGGKKLVGYHNVSNREGGEIIVCGTGAYCGWVTKNDNPFWASQCFTIKKLSVNLDNNYLYFITKYYLEKVFMENRKGVGQPYIRASQFINTEIPLPSLEIQKNIVEELSMIETNIKSIETRIKQFKEEKERFKKYSRKPEIKELLKDAEIKKLGEFCDFKWGKNIPKRDRVIKTENNYPYYGSNGISGYTENFTFEGRSMLLGDQGSQWFNSLQLTNTEEKYNISNHTINISVNNDINFDYIYYVLKSFDLKQFNKDSAMIPEINFNIFKDFKIPIPSSEIQEQCIKIYQEKANFIQSIEEETESHKKYINDLKQLSKDIIYSYC